MEKTRMFVYGTLLDEKRLLMMILSVSAENEWSGITGDIAGNVKEDSINGILFDSGHGFPYVVEGGERKVHGITLDLFIPEDELFSAIDKYEGTDKGLYERTQIITDSGEKAWIYLAGPAIIHASMRGKLLPKEIKSGRWMECNYVEKFSILPRIAFSGGPLACS